MERASRTLARWLIARGIAPGDRVAIFAQRTAALPIAILAVARAGAVFSLLDASYPPARAAACTQQMRPRALLYTGDKRMADAAAVGITVTASLPLPAAVVRDVDVAAALPEPEASRVAYLSFTSGTTGRPKGIVTTHAPLPHFVDWHVESHGFTADDRFSMLSGLAHDPLLRDVFTPLSIGACVCIPPQEVLLDPEALVRWIEEQRITVMHLTPALGQVIAAGVREARQLRSLRRMFWGGEALTRATIQQIAEHAPQVQHTNFYGATETPQAMASYAVRLDDGHSHYPVGKGIADTELLIVNEGGARALVNEAGEILIRSPYLSLGYLDDPAQTAARFVPNPLTNDPEDRCYRTGDIGKYRDDGNVVYVGRSDNQIKVRGFRVEPAEIERVVEACAGVKRALVRPIVDAGGTSIALYYAAAASVPERSVVTAIEQQLPSYMRPRWTTRLDAFPVLPNGKVDLGALPAPASTGRGDAHENDDGDALTPQEQTVANVWKAVLGVDCVRATDTFADLGGDSLRAIRVLVQMKRLGIPEKACEGILRGRTLREIVAGELAGPTPPLVEMLTLMNVGKGVLLFLVVAGHWMEGFVGRLPKVFAALNVHLAPLFNIATPGFAFMFGVSVAFLQYHRFLKEPKKAAQSLQFGAAMLVVGILLNAAFRLLDPRMAAIDATVAFSSLYSVMLYYLAATLSIPLWFWVIARFGEPIFGCVALAIASFALHHASLALLLHREQEGLLQLLRLLFVAKFAYFNLSLPVFAGMAAGIFARRSPRAVTTASLFGAGAAATCAGVLLALVERGTLTVVADGEDTGLWRWAFYAGVTLLLLGALRELGLRAPPRLLRPVGVFGQCTLVVFVLHQLVIPAKAMLVARGVPDVVGLAIPLLVFALAVGWLYASLARLSGAPPLTRA